VAHGVALITLNHSLAGGLQRVQGESCITTIRECYGATSCALIIEAAVGQIQQAEELRAAGNESW